MQLARRMRYQRAGALAAMRAAACPPRSAQAVDPPRTETTASGNRTANDRAANNAAERKWNPDHAVLSATKDQLKAMPQFKY